MYTREIYACKIDLCKLLNKDREVEHYVFELTSGESDHYWMILQDDVKNVGMSMTISC